MAGRCLCNFRPTTAPTNLPIGYHARLVPHREADGEPEGSRAGFPKIKVDNDVQIQKGNLYHFVFTNRAFDPVNNYVSIDDLPSAAPPLTSIFPSSMWICR